MIDSVHFPMSIRRNFTGSEIARANLKRRLRSVVPLLVALGFLVAACSSTNVSEAGGTRGSRSVTTGTIEGQYQICGGTLGPGGQQPPCSSTSGSVKATGPTGSFDAEVHKGAFTLRVAAGNYTLRFSLATRGFWLT